MLIKILCTATLLVVAWLSVQMLHTRQVLASLQHQLHQSGSQYQTAIRQSAGRTDDMISNLNLRFDGLITAQKAAANTVAKAAPPKVDTKKLKEKDQEILHLNRMATLQTVQNSVLQANMYSLQKDGENAAKALLSTKKSIWQLSEKWEKSKAALRGLMGPIDSLANKWKKGDFTSNTDKIQKVLQEVVAAQAPTRKI